MSIVLCDTMVYPTLKLIIGNADDRPETVWCPHHSSAYNGREKQVSSSFFLFLLSVEHVHEIIHVCAVMTKKNPFVNQNM